MTYPDILLVAATLASALLCRSARAQEAPPAATAGTEQSVLPTDCPTVAAADDLRHEAGRLFAEGETESAALRVASAARAFACSYGLVATAQAAFNAGVAYEAGEQAVRARYWFARYLEQAPDAEDRGEVGERITTLSARIAQVEAREQAARDEATRAEAGRRAEITAAAERAARTDAMARPAASSRGRGTLGVVGVIGGSAGIAAGITGVALYIVAGGLHDDFVAGGRTELALARRGEALDLAASSLWIAGGAVTLGGVALLLVAVLGPRTERAPTAARLAPYFAPRAGLGAECGLGGVF